MSYGAFFITFYQSEKPRKGKETVKQRYDPHNNHDYSSSFPRLLHLVDHGLGYREEAIVGHCGKIAYVNQNGEYIDEFVCNIVRNKAQLVLIEYSHWQQYCRYQYIAKTDTEDEYVGNGLQASHC